MECTKFVTVSLPRTNCPLAEMNVSLNVFRCLDLFYAWGLDDIEKGESAVAFRSFCSQVVQWKRVRH
jgi:hypothetical protein